MRSIEKKECYRILCAHKQYNKKYYFSGLLQLLQFDDYDEAYEKAQKLRAEKVYIEIYNTENGSLSLVRVK